MPSFVTIYLAHKIINILKMPISHLLGESFYHETAQPSHFNHAFEDISENIHGLSINTTDNQTHFIDNNEAQKTNAGPQKFVLIDTDAGTEDAWALFMSLAAQRSNNGFKIVGITTIYGNTAVDNVANNVTRTLDTVHENNIPIYKGMNSSMVGKYVNTQQYHGQDGFGDAKLPPIPTRMEQGHAVEAIIKMAEAYPGKLTMMCLGPLTNVAMAIKLRPDLKNLVKEIFILGGNMEGIGNITVSSEFNFFVDPEAVSVVLDNFGSCPIYILPWETCVKYGTLSHAWRTGVLGNVRTKEINLLNKIEARILTTYQDTWLVSDAVLAACLINPNVIKKAESYHCSVELSGQHTRGMMIVDKSFLQQKQSNATLIVEIDPVLYEAMLVWASGGPVFSKK